ncbi:MAG: alginate export family protein [Sediminicola sp.]
MILLLIFGSFPLWGQQFPEFKPARYDEDHSFLEKDTVPTWYKGLKYGKIGNRAYVGFGGDLRTQYLIKTNEGWSSELEDGDGFTLTRWLLHADLHLSENVRFFAELQSALANGKDIPIPIEENPLGVHQFFVDVRPFPKLPVSLRLGRQEVAYGSQRLISYRDAPNSRRAFDGVKAMFANDKMGTDIFYLHAVVDKAGLFDDTSSPDLSVWGMFSSVPLRKGELSFYYLGFRNATAVFYDGPGIENRHTVGARILKKVGNWQYDVEGGYQFGSIGDRNIEAWSTGLAVSYLFDGLKYSPALGLKADFISGDKDPTDQVQQTLNALFPPGAYFGLAAPIAPSNLIDVHPEATFRFGDMVSFFCDYALLWRNSRTDGLYRPNMTPFFELDSGATSRFIGSQLSGTLSYRPNGHLLFVTGCSWFDAGHYLKEVTEGKDILFGFVSAQVKF